MRFIMIVKSSPESEAGQMPSDAELAKVAKYNEELVKAGVMLDGTGLQPSSKGWKVKVDAAGKRSVVDGPFAEAKELVAGYWLIQTKTREEAIEWSRRIPAMCGEIEVRQLHELEDFGEGPGIEKHRELASQLAAQK